MPERNLMEDYMKPKVAKLEMTSDELRDVMTALSVAIERIHDDVAKAMQAQCPSTHGSEWYARQADDFGTMRTLRSLQELAEAELEEESCTVR